MTKLNESVKLMVCQVAGSNGETVVNVAAGFDRATTTVRITGAIETSVLDARLRIDPSAE